MPISNMAGQELAERLQAALPNVVEEWDEVAVWVKPDHMNQIAHFLTVEPTLDFNFLNSISAVDFVEYFEVVYHLTSLQQQHCAVIKTRVYGRGEVSLPSVYSVWRGADFLMGEGWDEGYTPHLSPLPQGEKKPMAQGYDTLSLEVKKTY